MLARYIYDYEINRLKELGVTFDVFDEVIHTSKVFGDGAGYDILSKEDEVIISALLLRDFLYSL